MSPEIGDLIEIFRGPYQHWAVYVGDGYVIHLAPSSEIEGGPSNMMSVVHPTAIVKKEKLRKVVGTNHWQVNNILDKDYEPRDAKVIVQEAESMLGQERPYSVLEKNCEHFATELRYGKPNSRQVRNAVAVGAGVAAGSVVVAVAAAVAAAMIGGGEKEKKSKRWTQDISLK